MKSLCIKNNNPELLNFIKCNISKIDLSSIIIRLKTFKLYTNIIIHYNGEDSKSFYDKISSILTDTIIRFYQKKLIRRIINYNYFYFHSSEKKEIIKIAEEFINSDTITKEDNYFAIYYEVLKYIEINKSLVLEGFINFRLSNYIKNLDYIVDIAVNKYITDKEYLEFVNLLKLYVKLTPSKESLIHLIYNKKKQSILLDNQKNIIPIDTDENFNQKYLSDITFSSNDYALNTLLNLTPKKLIIHLTNHTKEDEFINTLKLIFEGKYEICMGCEICQLTSVYNF